MSELTPVATEQGLIITETAVLLDDRLVAARSINGDRPCRWELVAELAGRLVDGECRGDRQAAALVSRPIGAVSDRMWFLYTSS